MVEKVNDSLNSIDRELSDINDGDKDKLSLWDSRLFNTWDWYSFLINEKRTTDKEIIDYFKDAVIHDYEERFLQYATDEERDDPKQYPEFKELYKKLKEE